MWSGFQRYGNSFQVAGYDGLYVWGFYTLWCCFCVLCLPLLILNRMGGCKFTIGDMSVFAQHALYTFINFVLNGECDFTLGENQ